MSVEDERARLRSEIDERRARIDELSAPMTHDEARALALADPDAFNAKVDAGLVPAVEAKEETS